MQNNNRVKFLSVLTGILMYSGIIQNDAYAASPSTAGNAAQGSKTWADNCARCHNMRSPTEFSARDWHLIMQHMRIQGGLTGQEARDVFAFLAASSTPDESAVSTTSGATSIGKSAATTKKTQHQAKNTSQTTSAQSGKAIYHQTCAACHGANGKGVLPGVPDFTSKNGPLKKSDATLLNHIENGFQSPGSPMAMAPKGGNSNLTNNDVKNVLSYIRNEFGSK